MRATVTGAGGFVGPHLTEHLRDRGDEVTEMDLSGPVRIDVTDADATLACIEAARPDVVYHLAAPEPRRPELVEPGRGVPRQREGTLHVLRACLEAKVSRVVVVLSSEVYGTADPEERPSREDAPAPSGDPLRRAARPPPTCRGPDAPGRRPRRGPGPAVRAHGSGPVRAFRGPGTRARIARAERDGVDEIPVGSLDAVRDLSDVRDVVRAYRLLADVGAPGEVYNVCSGVGVSIREIADRLLGHARREIRLVTDPTLVRPVDAP